MAKARCMIRIKYSKHQEGGMLSVHVEVSNSKLGYVNRTRGIASVEDAKKEADALRKDLEKIDKFDFFEVECFPASESEASKKARNAEIDQEYAELETQKRDLEDRMRELKAQKR